MIVDEMEDYSRQLKSIRKIAEDQNYNLESLSSLEVIGLWLLFFS